VVPDSQRMRIVRGSFLLKVSAMSNVMFLSSDFCSSVSWLYMYGCMHVCMYTFFHIHRLAFLAESIFSIIASILSY
jgi:hypothetical protein